MCISVNHGEAALASADILLFLGGRRVLGPEAGEVVRFQYTPGGWVDRGWGFGECGEWEERQYPTNARWQDAEPIAAADAAASGGSG